MKLTRLLLTFSLMSCAAIGCSDWKTRDMEPVKGRVTYKGQPLEFGSVMFQPFAGIPASGKIQPDGNFVLSTYKEGDGAAIGKHQVRIVCNERQRPGAAGESSDEKPTGKSLIPAKYDNYDASEIEIEVVAGQENFFELTLTD